MEQPNLSVTICNYNYGRFIAQAIESILKQSVLPKKLLIIDDGSKDNSQEIIKTYKSKYSSLIDIRLHKINRGMLHVFNEAVVETNTKYICKLDSDDYFDPTFIEKTVSALDSDPHTAIVYTDMKLVGERAKEVYLGTNDEWWGSDFNELRLVFPDYTPEKLDLLKRIDFIHNSAVCRTQVLKEAGGYRNTQNRALDHDLYVRILEKGYIAKRVPEPLLFYRQHSAEQPHNKLNRAQIETISPSKAEVLIGENKAMEAKIFDLHNKLQSIRRTKFYLLWRKYCQIKEKLTRK